MQPSYSKPEPLGTTRLEGREVDLSYLATPSGKELHFFPNPVKRPYTVFWSTDELTSLCPKTGQPDFCSLAVSYVPSERCLELKSAKLYIVSFRNEGHFYEELINLIYTDVWETLKPLSLRVEGVFNIRGGIPETVIVDSDQLHFRQEGEVTGWESNYP